MKEKELALRSSSIARAVHCRRMAKKHMARARFWCLKKDLCFDGIRTKYEFYMDLVASYYQIAREAADRSERMFAKLSK